MRPSSQGPDDRGPDATGGTSNGRRHDVQPLAHPPARTPRIWEARFRELCATIPVGVALCDLTGRFIDVNAALADTLERSATDLVGTSIYDLFHPDDAEYLARVHQELAEQDRPQRLQERLRLIRSFGEEAWANLSVSILRDVDGAPATLLTTVQDVSELHLLQERFQYQALHDVLTGLPNRQFFETRLEAALTNLPRDAEIAVYHLALDGFEVVNEGLGYHAGDALVRSVAGRLEKLIEGEEAMAARFGGTEFGILLRQTPNTVGVAQFAALINEELAEPIYVDEDYGIATSASIGVVQRSVSEGSAHALLRSAEIALRRAKAAGKRQWAMFDSERDPHERAESKLAAIIPGALEMGELTMGYRPVVCVADDRVVGVQANLHWEPSEHEPLGHASCLDLAERTGVTLCVRDWMLQTIGDQLARWRRAGSWPKVQVDFSPNQSTDPDLVAAVRRVLGDQESELGWLWVSFPMQTLSESDDARENVELLGSMGLETAVHDFRGSPEELRRLGTLPVKAVRLAPELVDLVHESPEEPEAQAVVRMLPLVQACDRLLVVDGIDTAEQAQWWRSVGCGIAVGAHYGDVMHECDVPVIG